MSSTGNAYVSHGMVIQPPSDDPPEPAPIPVSRTVTAPRPTASPRVVAAPQMSQPAPAPVNNTLQKNLVTEVFSDMVTETPSERPCPLVVLDCANIGHFFGMQQGFDARGVQLALEFFRGMNIEVRAFIPSSYIRIKPRDHSSGNGLMQTDDVSLLMSLVDSLQVTVVPSGDSDDAYILNYARNNNGFIVSNDLFNDHMRNLENPNAVQGMRLWLGENRSGYTFVENREFMINPVSSLAFRLRNYVVQQHISSTARASPRAGAAAAEVRRELQSLQSLTDLSYELYDQQRPAALKHVLLARAHLLIDAGLNRIAFEDLHFILKRLDAECPSTALLLRNFN